ncbi:3'-5' exonuclease [Spirochaeta cellobiosiphila]|uniref:3'-5' exonuclease n=1 Tax=Spirochaeta cellobiosiphila TaxID=504483 RepID=UPI0004143747|nr:3'-5' exonuclease [Spirochaeta cellobiosiphila]
MTQIIKYDSLINPDKIFVCFDTETTGLNPLYDRIIEIAAVKIKNGKVIGEFEELVNPNMPIPEESTKVHGITDNDVVGKESIEKVLPRFLSFIENTILIAHNAQFDIDFVNNSAKKSNISLMNNDYIDTLPMSRKAFPGRKSYSLQNMAKDFNIKVTAAHRALDDTRVCYRLFELCHDKLNPAKQASLF